MDDGVAVPTKGEGEIAADREVAFGANDRP